MRFGGKTMAQQKIVHRYARMWPREVFEKAASKTGAGRMTIIAKDLEFLGGRGVYILYRDDQPYYIGQAESSGSVCGATQQSLMIGTTTFGFFFGVRNGRKGASECD
jgi:hypothetical protein